MSTSIASASPNDVPGKKSSHLEIKDIVKRFGDFTAVDAVSFSMHKGERLALLGPSGCGKTTLLNIIAGFEHSEGQVRVAGRDITGVPPHKRNIGIVFQNYALFPHLTVAQNVGFGLRYRNLERAETDATVARALDIVRLKALGGRYPHQLSGGQQQRTAIARAIAIKPEILLLDEPLSNLDAKLREDMRADLLDILDELAISTILVTHDQSEALSLAHRVAVINAGKIEQLATPVDVYQRPKTKFVASFVGESNHYQGRIAAREGAVLTIDIDGAQLYSSGGEASIMSVGDEASVYIRAEKIGVGNAPLAHENTLEGELRHAIYLGGEQRLVMKCPIGSLTATQRVLTGVLSFKEGEPVHIGFDHEDVVVFPAR